MLQYIIRLFATLPCPAVVLKVSVPDRECFFFVVALHWAAGSLTKGFQLYV